VKHFILFVFVTALFSCTQQEQNDGASTITDEYIARSADFQNTIYDDILPGTAAHHRSALARIAHHFPDGLPDYVDITLYSTVYGNTYPDSQVGIAVFVDGALVGMANPEEANEEEEIRVELSGEPGPHTVALVEALQEETIPGFYAGTSLISADYGGNFGYTVVRDTTAEVVLEDTDSIGLGIGTPVAQRDGVQAQLAKLMPGMRFVSLGAGRRQLSTSYETATKRHAMVQRIVQVVKGSQHPRYIMELGDNDAGTGKNVAQAASYAALFLDELHRTLPTLPITLQTPLRTFRTDSYNERNIAPMRAALSKIAAARTWVHLVDGLALTDSEADYADGLHPNRAGCMKYAGRLYHAAFK